jgi:hypothetical protein
VTPQEIRAEILASSELRALIESGQDATVAQVLTDTLPGKIVPLRLSELGLLALYADPVQGETVLATIEAVAQFNQIVARVRKFMQAGTPEYSLPDFSLPGIRLALTAPHNDGGLGLTPELAAPIIAAMTVPGSVSHVEVSNAVMPWRPDGAVGPIPENAS